MSQHCNRCHAVLDDDAKFCPNCGQKVERTDDLGRRLCANCGSPMSDDARFCRQCGTKAAVPNKADQLRTMTAQANEALQRDPWVLARPALVIIAITVVFAIALSANASLNSMFNQRAFQATQAAKTAETEDLYAQCQALMPDLETAKDKAKAYLDANSQYDVNDNVNTAHLSGIYVQYRYLKTALYTANGVECDPNDDPSDLRKSIDSAAGLPPNITSTISKCQKELTEDPGGYKAAKRSHFN
ncbi:Double zinc ribbon [Bifidobacterium sp. DSM 109958]|uniref:Double zinc ribbon n=1 Tax=Bifidobacterium moraviense TaxID=2675323 RepID=A0A7Y0HXC1_9BIFI|nr:zinc ribbon domain-containing protein [Bifidobacterium sp. DSM 109958]NMN00126.1 Double zinc ribbon [Bifidobacterium sp. DSM 109958]